MALLAKFPPEKVPKRNAPQAPGRPILTHLSSFSAIGVLSTQTAPDKRPKAIGPSAIGVKKKGGWGDLSGPLSFS